MPFFADFTAFFYQSSYFLSGEGISSTTAEDEDLAVTEKNIMPLLLNAKSSLLMEEEYLSSLHYIADYSLIL